jgi:DNA recombination protein RmuC
MEQLYILAAAIIVGFGVWFLMNQKLKSEVVTSQSDLNTRLASIQARYDALEETRKNDKLQSESNSQQMMQSFDLAARKAFDEVVEKAEKDKSSTFTTATESLSKAMKDYSDNMTNIEAKSLERGTRLEERIIQVSELGLKLSDETNNLTRAMKNDSQAQGAWGELVLENLLQSLGFVKDTDYLTQTTFKEVEGRLRTDFIVKLPENRQIIIDSKVSLTAWERYVNAQSEEEMEGAMAAHCTSIRKHAKDLATKNYQAIEGVNTVDFVLMYVPLESAFSAAMKLHPDLYMEFAKDNHVRVVTGSTIVTTLMLIKDIWKREAQSRNQTKLIAEVGKLHDKIILFIEAFDDVGNELNQATKAFDLARGRLSVGDGNIIKRTDNLKKLGAKVTKEIGTKLLEEANYNHDNATD